MSVELSNGNKEDLNKEDLNKEDLNKEDLNKEDLNKEDINKEDMIGEIDQETNSSLDILDISSDDKLPIGTISPYHNGKHSSIVKKI